MINATTEDFDSHLEGTVLIDFWAPWCPPCKAMDEVLSKFSTEHTDIKVIKVNVDEEPGLQQEFEVSSIPTYLLVQDGDIIDRAVGAKSFNEIKEFVYDE